MFVVISQNKCIIIDMVKCAREDVYLTAEEGVSSVSAG